MDNYHQISATIDRLIEKKIAFASWYNPKERQMSIIIGHSKDVLFFEQFDQYNGKAGFVFAPYQITQQFPAILLEPTVYIEDVQNADAIDVDSFQPFDAEEDEQAFQVQTKESYLNLIEKTISEIKQGALSKVIISRQIPVDRTSESLAEIFFRLHDQTPNAMSYLVNLPKAGIWMGATPEVLIKTEQDQFETVSLAGTQVRKYTGEEYYWSTKDIEEQAFVSRYMLDVFFDFDIHQYKTSGPETLESGKVAHLKTSFYFPAEKISDRLGNFIAQLHPTPAVCGLPKTLAKEYIQKNEPYERSYYTGFLGPWKLNGKLSVFVNLRSMKILPEKLILYAGGGITSHSDPEKEWEETNQKARTLLSVIESQSR
jgi:isochorismate synthase